MIAAVIPTRNECTSVDKVINNLLGLPFDVLIPVINGCTDNTKYIIDRYSDSKIQPIAFEDPLGIDIPRAIGTKRALDLSATSVIFVDGDMVGNISTGLLDIIYSLEVEKFDMALTDCYDHFNYTNDSLAQLVLKYRRLLNLRLNLEKTIGVSSPSHGPHGVSKKLISTIGYQAIAIPPLTLTLARLNDLTIKVATKIPHQKLGSLFRSNLHSGLIAETIIGDCLQAIAIYENKPPARSWGKREFLGYHTERRWDLLEEFINN